MPHTAARVRSPNAATARRAAPAAPRSRGNSSADTAVNSAASASPAGVASANPPLRLSSSTPGRGQGVQHEEQGRGEEPEPDEQQPRVVVPLGRAVDDQREADVHRRDERDQPEVRRVVLHRTSVTGTASRSHSPSSGSARWNSHTASRTGTPLLAMPPPTCADPRPCNPGRRKH